MFLYKCDGDYTKVGEFGKPSHGGGIYGVSVRLWISLIYFFNFPY